MKCNDVFVQNTQYCRFRNRADRFWFDARIFSPSARLIIVQYDKLNCGNLGESRYNNDFISSSPSLGNVIAYNEICDIRRSMKYYSASSILFRIKEESKLSSIFIFSHKKEYLNLYYVRVITLKRRGGSGGKISPP